MSHSSHYRFSNRTEAGRLLASALTAYANRANVIVLALPRGGVPVAFEIARVLHAPLGICVVRKLGVPGHGELAMGAIASGGVRVLNQDVLSKLNISDDAIDRVTQKEKRELERREQLYYQYCNVNVDDDELSLQASLNVENRIVILVDDGIATGSTLQAAILGLKQQHPQKLIVAAPVAPPMTCQKLRQEADEIVCLITPDDLYAIGAWYDDFEQVTDEEVKNLLSTATPERGL